MTITQEQIDAIKEDCEKALRAYREQSKKDPHGVLHPESETFTTLPATDVLAIIEEVEKLRKQTGWNFNMDEAPRGTYKDVVTQDKNGKEKTVTRFVPQTVIASRGECITPSKWIPDEKRWTMFTADHPPTAWMPWTPPKEANDE